MLFSLALSIPSLPFHSASPCKTPIPASSGPAPARSQLAGILNGSSMSRLDPWSILREGAISPADLSAALATRPRRLGLFRSDAAVDGRRELLRRMPFGAILAAAGERNRVDSLLLAAVVETESRFAPHAVSPCGAVGLMQLLPSTGQDYGVKDLRDPYANVDAGSRYLRALLDRFQGRPDLAIAAYNTGPEVVARYGCVPPYRETQDFVKRVLSRYGQHQHALAHVSVPRPGEVRLAAGPSRDVTSSGGSEGEGLAR
ncbi:MAG TPA: lytic transglycosylase domain-containing protein [Thermoanaerobaculia bacterium]|nr:lytic transglycosylase domain-containing protein [Thermoanaerobaculia bacterium]